MDPVSEPRRVDIPERKKRETEKGIRVPCRLIYKGREAKLYSLGYGPEGEIGFLRFPDGSITWTKTNKLHRMWAGF